MVRTYTFIESVCQGDQQVMKNNCIRCHGNTKIQNGCRTHENVTKIPFHDQYFMKLLCTVGNNGKIC